MISALFTPGPMAGGSEGSITADANRLVPIMGSIANTLARHDNGPEVHTAIANSHKSLSNSNKVL